MKKLSKIILTGVLATLSLTSCQRDLASLNEDPKHPSLLPSENLFATALYQSSYYMDTPSVNFNNYRFFTQQWAEVEYPDETQYDLVTRNQPRNYFNRMYVYTINNIRTAKTNLIEEANTDAIKANKLASLEIEEVFVWETLVDTYGNVPYSEAFKPDVTVTPKYDDAKTIYKDLIQRLDTAIGSIQTSASGYTKGDLIYYGNMTKWIKFANSLKLRLAMNLADEDPTLSRSTAEQAIAAGVITSDADSYKFVYDGGTFLNPVYDNLVASNRDDFTPSELVINTMSAKNDPRMEKWFTKVNGAYVGGVFGEKNLPYTNFSHLNDFFRSATNASKLLSFTEVSFLKAEAAARGYNVGDTAVNLYNAAVTASLTENGVASADIATYLAVNSYNAADWKKSIGVEAWIALFNHGLSNWNITRRLDSPVFINPPKSVLSGVPVRMPYSDQEYVLNNANVSAAATAIGGDKATTKLFWDKF